MTERKLIVPGKWFTSFDADGNVITTVYDESFRSLLGYSTDEYADGNEAWEESIHPDDAERVSSYFAECCRRHPEGMDYDIEYRMMTKYGYRLFHDSASCVRRGDGSPEVMYGLVFDIQDSAEMDRRRNKLIANMAGGVASYIINPETDDFQILSQNGCFSEKFAPDDNFSASFRRYAETCVFGPDRKKALERINTQSMASALEKEKEYYVRYRDITSGFPRWYEMRAIRLSDTEILVGFSDRDLETVEKSLYGKLMDNYAGLYCINLDAGCAQIMKTGFPELTGEAGTTVPYAPLIEKLAPLAGNQAEEFLRGLGEEKYIKEHFRSEDTAYRIFRSSARADGRWVNCTAAVLSRQEDGTPSYIALGFSPLDDEACEKEEANLRSKEQEKLLEAQMRHNTVLNQIIKAGPWLFRFDGDDRVTDTELTPEALAVIRNDAGNGFEWMKLVHPDDKERVTAGFAACLKDRSCRTQYDEEYRIRSRDGEYHWIHAAGRMRRFPDGSGELYGVCSDIDDTVRVREEKQQELKKALAAAEEEKNRNDTIHEIIHSGKWSFFVNADDEIVAADVANAADKVIKNELGSEAYSWLDVVHPDDKAYARAAFDATLKDHSCATPYDVNYRMADRNGNYRWFRSAGRIVRDSEGNGEFFGVHIDVTDQIVEQLEQKAQIQESLTFTNFFLNTYVSAYYVNLDDLSCQVYKRTDSLETDFPIITNYFDSLRNYINTDVHPEDSEVLLEAVQPEKMKAALAEKNEYSHIFRNISSGTDRTYRMQVIRGAEKNHAAFGFIDITDEVNEQNSRIKDAEESRKLIESVAASYEVAYAVDMTDGTYRILKDRGGHLKDVGNSESFDTAKEKLFRLVHPSDAERMKNELEFSVIKEKLKERKSYNIEFRVLSGGSTSWHEMNVTGIDENRVAFGFAERDIELTKLHLEEKRYEEYFALYVLDVDTEMLKIIKNEQMYRQVPVGKSVHCAEYFRNMAQSFEGEVREFYLQISDMENVKREFETDDKRTFSYKSPNLEGNRWVDVTAYVISRHDDGTPSMITLGFSIMDSLATVRKEQQKLLEEALEKEMTRAREEKAYQMAILSNAYSYFQTNLTRNTLIPPIIEKVDGKAVDYTPKFGAPLPPYDNVIRTGAKLYVDRDYKDSYTENLSSRYLIECYNAGNMMPEYTCYIYSNILGWHYRKYVTYLSKDEASGDIYGMVVAYDVTKEFEAREKEKRYKEELEEAYSKVSDANIRNEMLYEIGSAVKWSFEIGADSRVTAASYGENVADRMNPSDRSDPRAWIKFLHPDDRDRVTSEFDNAVRERSGKTQFDTTYRMKDRSGEYRWYKASGRIVGRGKGRRELFGISMDITKQMEQEREQQRLLEAARVAADVANRSKTNFLFNMSHDIRTPMNAITGFTAMAKKHITDEKKVSDYLDKIDTSGKQLLNLVNQVLEMARIESGKIELVESHVNIHNEYDAAVTVLSEQAKANGLEFHHTLSDLRHNRILADTARMSSITFNITGNAMKYTPAGGRIDFMLREIPARKKGYATFVYTVEDTGIGMSEEYLKVLFDPFTREKSSTVSRIQGTGLGMSIVKELVDKMGGTIEVRSEPGKGTRFDITLDFKIDEESGNETAGDRGCDGVRLKGRRVLLVEDNEMNREIARDILEEQGIVVEDADDGDVAVDMVRKVADRGEYGYYDFILMDVQMPRMNGYEATKAIRGIAMPEGVHIPIIAMTANAFEEDRQNALATGMDEHLAKPIDVQKMIRTISKFL